ncbi:MAG: restriction endonuclease subunit S, partial [Rhizobiaceae bacterium]|nr:restriction endonuclease subunit S [Rhizobiaceae bacterium]
MGMHANPLHSRVLPNDENNAQGKTDKSSSNAKIENLLMLEAEVRRCKTLRQLQFLIANETGKLIASRQILVMHGFKTPAIVTVSSLASLDKTSPTLVWLEKSLTDTAAKLPVSETAPADNSPAALTILDAKTSPGGNWPFCQALYVDLPLEKKSGLAKFVLLSERKFSAGDIAMANRLAETYAHAWDALVKSKISLSYLFTKKVTLAIAVFTVLMMFFPVTMTVLAPVEIIARNPVIVAAPLNGVIEKIEIDPNTRVKKGDLLFAGSGETAEDIGKCFSYLGDEYAVAGGDIVILRPKDVFNSCFLGYILNTSGSVNQKYYMGQGSSVYHIYSSSLRNLKIPLPPTRAEQTAIATALSDMDALIEGLEKLLVKKRNIK